MSAIKPSTNRLDSIKFLDKTWSHSGLTDTQQEQVILVSPANYSPDRGGLAALALRDIFQNPDSPLHSQECLMSKLAPHNILAESQSR